MANEQHPECPRMEPTESTAGTPEDVAKNTGHQPKPALNDHKGTSNEDKKLLAVPPSEVKAASTEGGNPRCPSNQPSEVGSFGERCELKESSDVVEPKLQTSEQGDNKKGPKLSKESTKGGTTRKGRWALKYKVCTHRVGYG